MMKPLLISVLALAASGAAVAADTDPLDFDYQVVARASERPALIFNDGQSTYIQPRAGQLVTADGAQQNGPYWVIDGVPDVVRYSVNGQSVIARWKRANGFTGEPANPVGDLPGSLAGFSGRIALIGQHGDLALVRAGRSVMPLAAMVKSLAPAGWSGTAQKDIALTEDVSLQRAAGENWLQALGRVLEQRNLYAEVDFERQHVTLRATAPKAFAVDSRRRADAPAASSLAAAPAPVAAELVSTSVPTSATAASATTRAAAPAPAVGTAAEPLTLATAFDANAIRDTKTGRIEIRFDQKPGELLFHDGAGKRLSTEWRDEDKALSLATVDRFTVRGGGKAVEVARVPGIHYLFAQQNEAGLSRVFEKDGATYLSFDKSMGSISVFDESRRGSGEHKDRYYKFNGISTRLTVVADGNVVQVDRVPEVRFYERAVTQ
ncbi:protein PilL (plasmid) [Cupriavidus necator N-1]|uniref:Protein PilL n=1 Tax=Cupriavidus necator (strain ATCC 43291 / DSM 13513 / CCUG 52238 / LMG 8453 / N-1) TaxID=1042878 RepID=F8GY59_CUPNN|nr:protein PilL [Cupriavidus necator]AEI83183.1 protein PilL [Cupriavidus necator N-1]MDX6008595.1 pilus assembly protein PilL [Cupriavidus necator]